LWSASGLCKFCMTVFLSVTDGWHFARCFRVTRSGNQFSFRTFPLYAIFNMQSMLFRFLVFLRGSSWCSVTIIGASCLARLLATCRQNLLLNLVLFLDQILRLLAFLFLWPDIVFKSGQWCLLRVWYSPQIPTLLFPKSFKVAPHA
jgi:hypothetical protein